MATKAKMGKYSQAFLGRDSSRIKGFNRDDFAVKGDTDPGIPCEVEDHIDGILSGAGLHALLAGTWETESGNHMNLPDLPPEIKQWAEVRLTEADRYVAAKKLARATNRLQKHFTQPDWQNLSRVWEELRDYPQLRSQYEKSHGIIFCPHDWIGYAVHHNKKTGKFLVKGLYRQADIKHVNPLSLPSEQRRWNYQYHAREKLDNYGYHHHVTHSWQKRFVGLPFDRKDQAETLIVILEDLHIQVKICDFAEDNAPPTGSLRATYAGSTLGKRSPTGFSLPRISLA